MGGRPLEGPTMGGRTSDWKEELGCFLKPFLARLGHKARRQMCPLYVSGLDEQAGSVGARGCSGRISNGTNETGDGSGGDRLCHRGRCALWLRVGGCRLWAERAVRQGLTARPDVLSIPAEDRLANARRAPRHPRTHRSTTAAAMPALTKMDL